MNTMTAEAAAGWAAGEERRRFLLAALGHDAVDDAVTELLFEHVVLGRYHWTVVANSLAPILSEVTEVADESDWAAAADHVLDPDPPASDPAGSRRSEQGTDFTVALIRGFLRALSDDPLVRERLRSRPEVERRGFDPGLRGGVLKEEILDALRAGTEEDWNIVAGQLIAEAREVTGPAAGGGRV
ncbi:MAG: hypothetical protein JSU06_00415 [Actinobacteria bacterium]|nr:hypothetical protein [Actinomycetota bacterium]